MPSLTCMILNKVVLPARESVYKEAKGQPMPPRRWPTGFHYVHGALLREFIYRGWSEPGESEWASPCFVVPNKVAGQWRLVVDYRGLNAQTQHNSYMLLLIEDMLQKQFWRRIFKVINVKNGYHQTPLAEESCACTARSTPLGPRQLEVMPMGVTNGNAAFQRMLEKLLELVRDCADPFVEDVIIASGTPA